MRVLANSDFSSFLQPCHDIISDEIPVVRRIISPPVRCIGHAPSVEEQEEHRAVVSFVSFTPGRTRACLPRFVDNLVEASSDPALYLSAIMVYWLIRSERECPPNEKSDE